MAWTNILVTSFQGLWLGVAYTLPRLLGAIIIFVVGWIIASAIGKFIAQIIRILKVDKAFQSIGIEGPLQKMGFRLDVGAFLGGLVEWFLIVVFLVASLDVLGLAQVNAFLKDVVLAYLPNVIVAALILIIAEYVANTMYRIVVGSAKAAGARSTHLLGMITKWSIWIFAVLAALYQLGIAGVFAQTLFTGFVAMLAIAGGLAFGMGGKDTAARYLDKLQKGVSDME